MFDIAPIKVHLKVTNNCNLHCTHCNANAGNKLQDELSTKEILKLIDELEAMGVLSIGVTGGEPFLHKDIFLILKYIIDKNMALDLNTNGTVLDKEKITSLKDLGIKRIMISLDGATPKIHDAIRGVVGAFENTMAAIKKCMGSGIDIFVRTVVMRNNLKEIRNIVDLIETIGVKRYGIVPVLKLGQAQGNINRIGISANDWQNLVYDLERYIKAKNKRIHLVDTFNFFHFGRQEVDSSEWNKYLVGCKAGKTQCSIFSNGDVFPCTLLQDKQFLAGNIRNNSIKEIWNNSPVFNKFRSLNTDNLKGVCSKCDYRFSCGGGCRAFAYQSTMRIDRPDPKCPYTIDAYEDVIL